MFNHPCLFNHNIFKHFQTKVLGQNHVPGPYFEHTSHNKFFLTFCNWRLCRGDDSRHMGGHFRNRNPWAENGQHSCQLICDKDRDGWKNPNIFVLKGKWNVTVKPLSCKWQWMEVLFLLLIADDISFWNLSAIVWKEKQKKKRRRRSGNEWSHRLMFYILSLAVIMVC